MLIQEYNPTITRPEQFQITGQNHSNYYGAQLRDVQPGHVVLEISYHPSITQRDGNFHPGTVTNIIDAACTQAAQTLTDSGVVLRTVAYKVDILERTRGEKLIIHGRVLRSGRNVTMCHGEALVVQNGQEQLFATMLITMMVEDA